MRLFCLCTDGNELIAYAYACSDLSYLERSDECFSLGADEAAWCSEKVGRDDVTKAKGLSESSPRPTKVVQEARDR